MEAALSVRTRSAPPLSKKRARVGVALSALAALFLLFDSTIKLVKIGPVVDSFVELGWSPDLARGVGALQLACLLLYLVPRTAPLGVVLLTGYLGGAIATHVRVGSPLFSHILFPIYVAALLWGGLALRDPRARALILDAPSA